MNQPQKILLVDDNDELRDVTRELLEEMGYAVTVAASGDEVVDRLMQQGATCGLDVLVADVFMPGASGLEVADRLLADDPELAVVLMSSHGGDAEVVCRLGVGDISFLSKPFASEDLATKIAEACDRAARRATMGRHQPATSHPFGTALAKPPMVPGSRSLGVASLARWQMVAAVVVVLGLGTIIRGLEFGPPPLPAPVIESVERSASIEALSPVGTVPDAPVELGWSPVADARVYEVRLMEIEGTVLWQVEIDEPRTELPPDVLAKFDQTAIYYWSVEALNANRRRLASSGPIPFSIDPVERKRPDPHRG